MKWKKNEAQNSEARIEKLAGEVRSAAQQSMEALWSAFLEVGELDMVRATEKALRLTVSHGNCTGAMKVLEGVYALVEIAPSEDFTDCQQYPALAQMFMDEEMEQMVESVKERGVLSPVLVRPMPDGSYQMVSGHRRKLASELAELPTVPCIVRELTDDEAIIKTATSSVSAFCPQRKPLLTR